MKCAKIVAIISVLAMVAVTFIVFAENDDSNAETVPTKTLDELISEGNFWIKVTTTEEEGITFYHISNNDSGNVPCIVNCDGKRVIVEGNGKGVFTIPNGCKITASVSKETYERPEFTMENVNMVIEGDYYTDDNTTITMKKSNMIIDGGTVHAIGLVVDSGCSIQAYESAIVDKLDVNIYDGEDIKQLFDMDYTKSGVDENDGFQIMFNDEGTLMLCGTFIGYKWGDEIISQSTIFCEKTVLKDIELINMYLFLFNEESKLIIDETDGKLDIMKTGSIISLSTINGLNEKFVSANDRVLLITKIKITSGMTGAPFDFIGEFDKDKCISSFECCLKFVGTEGVDKIKSNSIDDSYLFFNREMSCDLTKVTVICESGYSFDGWYTMDENGVEMKITNPEQFTPHESVTVYAKATKNQSDSNWFYTTAIVILVIIAIIALAGLIYFILKDRGILY